MNFTIDRKIEDGVFSVHISHKEFGSEAITAEEEAQLFNDFGFPEIDTGGPFEGVFSQDEEAVVENEEGSSVTLLLNSKKVKVTENFQAELLVNLNKIEDSAITPLLPTKQSVAEARCLLFEREVIDRLNKAIEVIREKRTGFEAGYPKDVII
ncbi:hypothetical protein [Bacillus atrophaeus]|uniref:hypothetical protein n=1 Tax=Bacillus atrophaeus TaxID=1452 RepID=UPI002E1A22C2|nr:hypothetical protein [Bacillus atrophaeus]